MRSSDREQKDLARKVSQRVALGENPQGSLEALHITFQRHPHSKKEAKGSHFPSGKRNSEQIIIFNWEGSKR